MCGLHLCCNEVKEREETFLKWRTWTCRLLCMESPRRAHRRDGETVALVVDGNRLSVRSAILTETEQVPGTLLAKRVFVLDTR